MRQELARHGHDKKLRPQPDFLHVNRAVRPCLIRIGEHNHFLPLIPDLIGRHREIAARAVVYADKFQA